jgi:uncharacterized Zn finger protein (UPF0148 family)
MEALYLACPKCGVIQFEGELPEGTSVTCPQCQGQTFTVTQLFKILGDMAEAKKAGKTVLEPIVDMLNKAMVALQSVLTTFKEETDG